MKQLIIQTSLITTLALGLSACGGGGSSSSAFNEYDGTWKSSCQTIGSRSYKQEWNINGESLENNVTVWGTSTSCQSGTTVPVKITANMDYQNKVDVANTCIDGKAQEVDVTYTSMKIDNYPAITGEQNIQTALADQGIDNALPKYGLICKGSDGNLYRGLITSDKDASTAAKRPDEMDTTDSLAP